MGKNAADVPAFRQEVYAIVAAIPPGAGLPCHRVVNSAGRTAPHWLEQAEKLKEEGVVFRGGGCVDMKVCRWNVDQEGE